MEDMVKKFEIIKETIISWGIVFGVLVGLHAGMSFLGILL